MANHTRKFDWDEAARLYARLGSYCAVGRELGVTGVAIRLALDADFRREHRAYAAARQKERRAWIGVCVDCGGPATKTGRGRSGTGRCLECSAKHRTASARADTLRCSLCHLWLPDVDFPRQWGGTKARRQRHHTCRACCTVQRRDYRIAERAQRVAS